MSRIPSRIPQCRRTSTPGQPPQGQAGSLAPAASLLQKRVFTEALSKSGLQPKRQVRAFGASSSKIRPPSVRTDHGCEQVIRQVVTEKTVQRTPKAEVVSKYVRGVEADDCGEAFETELASYRIDPEHATESRGVNETVSVTSTLSVTASGTHKSKFVRKRTVKDDSTANCANMSPMHVSRLVREETEDVENTLKMVPPDLVSTSIDKYPLKKKLHELRLTSDSMAFLEQSVCQPTPTADEIDTEAPPEVLATIIHAVEKGASPKTAPQQIFNTLFQTDKEEKVDVSCVAPGPLEDVVIPTSPAREPTAEVLTDELEAIIEEKVQNSLDILPLDDIAFEKQITSPQRTPKGSKKSPIMIAEEVPPWMDEDVLNISGLVGADPIFGLDPTDTSTMLDDSANLTQELAKGIDYILDADTVPYENRFQLRGTRLPTWFPGYMAVFPHLPDLVQISRKPSAVMHTAWKTVQPKLFPEDSILIL